MDLAGNLLKNEEWKCLERQKSQLPSQVLIHQPMRTAISNWATQVCALAFMMFLSLGCKHSEPEPLRNRPAIQPINSIRVAKFKCANEVIGEAVRNVYVEMLGRYGDVRVVTEGDADVAIEGTVTVSQVASSASGFGGGPGFIAGKSEAVAGQYYVSGVTAIAARKGEIITSASWGQPLQKGEDLLPPETVARRAADSLLGALRKEGLKRR